MMDMVEECLGKVAIAIHGQSTVRVGEYEIDFSGPYEKLSMYESINKYTGIDVLEMDEEALRQTCKNLGIDIDETMGRGKLIDELFSEKVEAHLIQPT